MQIYDITRPLSRDIVVYPGDIVPAFVQQDTGAYLVTSLVIGSHTGTHIDAPAHYIRGGTTIDRIPLEMLIGPARVIDLTEGSGAIGPGELAGRVAGVRTLLIKTSFSGMQSFSPDYRHLGTEAAAELAGGGVRCVGIDTPSVERYGGDGSVHRQLLGAGMAIVELLDLSAVPEGDYLMVALPLRLRDGDGSPARVVLLDRDSGGME